MNVLAAAGLALLAGAGLGATAPAAGAQEPQSPQSASGADRLSQAQLPEARRSAEVAKRLFSRIDQNDDGQITPEEWSDWHDTEFVAASKSSQGRPAAD
jgi:hypothetical protein